jgi:mono/diheme cytochrome c family protein
MRRLALVAFSIFASVGSAVADEAQVERGKYLVSLGGCAHCHTPGAFFGHTDKSRFLGGSDVGFAVPGLGVFVGRNLTPDKETGLGDWSDEDIVKALTTGVRPDGRILAPIMPWADFSNLSAADGQAIVAFLRSIPAVKNPIPGPFGSDEKPSVFVQTIVPGAVYASMPKPPPK